MKLLKSLRFWLIGPVVLLTSLCIMATSSLWLPKGNADLDNLVFPVIAFPLIWGTLFFYGLLSENRGRAALVLLGLLFINGGIVAAAIMGFIHV